MEIVIVVIVILVVAILVLTIFGTGISPIVDYTAKRNLCISEAQGSCSLLGSMPTDWNTQFQYKQGDQTLTGTCGGLAGCSSCDTCFPAN